MLSEEAKFCDLQSYREFFSIFELWKNYAVWNFSFLGKNELFKRRIYNSKTKTKFGKKLSVVL